MADGLYGVKQASKTKAKDISSSTSLAFSTNLSALISSSSSKSTSTTTAGRARPSKTKSDIFTAHNKNVKKRSAADLEERDRDRDNEQRHKTKNDIGSVNAAELHRSKRKMEEKTRLYNAMKRGEYMGRSDDSGLVDFDRKWAESRGDDDKRDGSGSSSGSDSDNGFSDSNKNEETVSYLDEFGRLRKGTSAQRTREEQRQRVAAAAAVDAETMSAHPQMPENLIYGDAVQRHAFNPDARIAEQMAALAEKRDKSATPPPEVHFDANAEVRTKGTGFYGFSQDQEQRKREMEELEKERTETERVRKEREEVKERRKKDIEERRRLVDEQRARKRAEKFLDGLDVDLERSGDG